MEENTQKLREIYLLIFASNYQYKHLLYRKERRKIMIINHKTALQLWNEQFGKETKVTDFAGRKMVKGAYNDRKSKYGWNIDHIQPLSRNGKSDKANLICCHILTNDEKKNHFPSFTANDINFQIQNKHNQFIINKIEKMERSSEMNVIPKNTNSKSRKLAEGYYVSNEDINTGLNNNDLIIGCSGSGKTRGYVIPLIAETEDNLVITDTKGQLYRLTENLLRAKGYKVMKIDFVNPLDSYGYNPMDYIEKTEYGHSTTDIATLAKNMMYINAKDDPFWPESAISLLECIIGFVMENIIEEEHNIDSVIKVFNMFFKNSGKDYMKIWTSEHPDSYITKKYDMFMSVSQADKTLSSILAFVSQALSPYTRCELQNIYNAENKRKVNFYDLDDKKTAIFLNVSDTDRYADVMIKLFYSQLFQITCKMADNNPDGRLKRPLRIILDDFASNVEIECFDKLMSVIRSRNISASIIIQDISQLDGIYGPKANTIVNNCDHTLYLGGQDEKTINFIARHTGINRLDLMTMSNDNVYVMERGSIGVRKTKSNTTLSEFNFTEKEDFTLETDIADITDDIILF